MDLPPKRSWRREVTCSSRRMRSLLSSAKSPGKSVVALRRPETETPVRRTGGSDGTRARAGG